MIKVKMYIQRIFAETLPNFWEKSTCVVEELFSNYLIIQEDIVMLLTSYFQRLVTWENPSYKE